MDEGSLSENPYEMTAEELTAFLSHPYYCVVASLRRSGAPVTTVVGYEWDGEYMRFSVRSTRMLVTRLAHDPRMSVAVYNNSYPAKWVVMQGRAEVIDDPDYAFARKSLRRYLGDQQVIDQAVDLDEYWKGYVDAGRVTYRMKPSKILSEDTSKHDDHERGGGAGVSDIAARGRQGRTARDRFNSGHLPSPPVLIAVRYAFRNPSQWARPPAELYGAVLDQIAWADRAGFDQVALSEHHFLEDGFLPGLLTVAAAVAARTKRLTIATDVLLLPLHHPVRVAEDAALADIISGGRLELRVAGGYREREYAGFGLRLAQRPGRMEESLQILKGLWAEEVFSFQGRYFQLDKVRLTPKPVQSGGPRVLLGGGTEAVARRAARFADGLHPMNNDIWDAYYDELERLGRPTTRKAHPPPPPMFVHVTQDPERDWARIRPHAAYETGQYAAWGLANSGFVDTSQITDETLQAAHAVWTPDEAVAWMSRRQADYPDSVLTFAPLLAGMDPALAQASLELIADRVLPALRAGQA